MYYSSDPVLDAARHFDALYGIDQTRSNIVSAVPSVWLEAIEIIPCSDAAVESIGWAPYVTAE